MKQTTIIAMFASLLFSGVATACQHNVATIPAQDYAGNAFNTSAAPSPDTKDRKEQAGKDEVIDTREYQVKDFDHIDCGTIANIYFTQGNETRVVAKLRHGNLDLLEVSTHNGCLKLRTADLGLSTKRFSIGKRNRAYVGDLDGKHSEQQEVDLYITAPSLRKLEMSGVCTFSAEHLNVPKLDIVMAGVNQVKLSDVTCNETNMMISGVAAWTLPSRATKSIWSIQGQEIRPFTSKERRRKSQTVVSESSPQRWTAKHCAQSIAAWHR